MTSPHSPEATFMAVLMIKLGLPTDPGALLTFKKDHRRSQIECPAGWPTMVWSISEILERRTCDSTVSFIARDLKIKDLDVHSVCRDSAENTFFVKFKDETVMKETTQRLQTTETFTYGDGKKVQVHVATADGFFRYVRIFNLPPEFTDADIAKVMAKFGTVRQIVREKLPSDLGFDAFNGTRGVHMEVKLEIPPALYIGHFKCRIFYEGLRNRCFVCKEEGHVKADCPSRPSVQSRIVNTTIIGDENRQPVTFATITKGINQICGAESSDPQEETAVLEQLEELAYSSANVASLLKICERSESGRKFLDIANNDNESNLSTPECREYIIDAVVEHFFVLGKGKILASDSTKMVQIICNQLPHEDPRTWYIPKSQNQAAAGLLFTRYKYMQQHDTRFKKGIYNPTAATAENEQQPESPKRFEDQWNQLSAEERDQCQAAKIKLNIIGFDRKEEIMNLWITSYPLRRFQSVTGKLAFGDWDVLTYYVDVHQLISVDFKKILPNHVRHEERIFPFVRRFKNIFENYKQLIVEDMDLLNNLASIFTDHFQLTEYSIFLALYALPLIIRQYFIKIGGRKRTKPSLLQSRQAFICVLATEATLEETIASRQLEARNLGKNVQPFIVAFGSIANINNKFFVILDNIKFPCSSIVSVLDLLFKLHTVFHLRYAEECENVLNSFADAAKSSKKTDLESCSLLSGYRRCLLQVVRSFSHSQYNNGSNTVESREIAVTKAVNITLGDILDYIGDSIKPLREGQSVFESGHVVCIGYTNESDSMIGICGFVPQSSHPGDVPHEVKLHIGYDFRHWILRCVCKAGTARCKHIVACLLHLANTRFVEYLTCTSSRQAWGISKSEKTDLWKAKVVRNLCCARKHSELAVIDLGNMRELLKQGFDRIMDASPDSAVKKHITGREQTCHRFPVGPLQTNNLDKFLTKYELQPTQGFS
ncbi:uncharacterized protein LOC129728189 [Wyeomyia smithii]|uniref:uncharacterized protein LOC129728189 n=1 Tax=Wyeomyia smithii TaxID=174621 RepID=UPI002467F6F6|nr:uncharacterized protein LOC129728189 [Wyeomyia smithii]